jgi:hypothetical protein
MQQSDKSPLQLSGDFRLRYEANSADGAIPSWDRGVLRGRLAALFRIDDSLEVGARLVTGDADNPRTADTTIADFASDLELSLDQAFVSYRHAGLKLAAGKFANPFTATELVWDGDVNPQGIGGYYESVHNDSWSTRATAVYFLIDESIFAADSSMRGAQLSTTARLRDDWHFSLHAAYLEYALGPLGPDAPGLARGNNLAPGDTSLLSDFELLDIVASIAYSGISKRWPLRLVTDFVKNRGAAVAEDSGYGFDLFAGQLEQPGDLPVRYGYSQTETDAVLGMFSTDNITYATNCRLHNLSIDYVLNAHMFVGLTVYRYGHLDPVAISTTETGWVTRTRLNLYFTF